jgi:hypothetical protein
VSVAVAPESDTDPETAPAPPFNVKVVVVIEAAAIGSENVACTTADVPTPVAPGEGTREITVGGVVSGGGAVVNVQT